MLNALSLSLFYNSIRKSFKAAFIPLKFARGKKKKLWRVIKNLGFFFLKKKNEIYKVLFLVAAMRQSKKRKQK